MLLVGAKNVLVLISMYYLTFFLMDIQLQCIDSKPSFLVSEGGVAQPPLWSRILIKLSHFLLSLSSAANIVIYSAKVC